MNNVKKTIDAQGKSLGRVASEAAVFLRGKESALFTRNLPPMEKLSIINASKIKASPLKEQKKTYKRHSGYPGGLKTEIMSKLIARKGYGEALKKAISGMLPKNRLKAIMLRNLTIKE